MRLSTHIAGSLGHEVAPLAYLVNDEFERWDKGKTLDHEVTPEMLERMAWGIAERGAKTNRRPDGMRVGVLVVDAADWS